MDVASLERDIRALAGGRSDLWTSLDRPGVSGFDDRGGSMALWFTAEVLRTLSWPRMDAN